LTAFHYSFVLCYASRSDGSNKRDARVLSRIIYEDLRLVARPLCALFRPLMSRDRRNIRTRCTRCTERDESVEFPRTRPSANVTLFVSPPSRTRGAHEEETYNGLIEIIADAARFIKPSFIRRTRVIRNNCTQKNSGIYLSYRANGIAPRRRASARMRKMKETEEGTHLRPRLYKRDARIFKPPTRAASSMGCLDECHTHVSPRD